MKSQLIKHIGILVSAALSFSAVSVAALAISSTRSSDDVVETNAAYSQTASQYYSGIDWDLTQAALKTKLYEKINITTAGWTYAGLWTAYKTTDKRSNGTLWDIYSDSTQYEIGGSKQGANYSKEGDSYNREHMIPQSIFSENAPMVSDAHHVLPSDGYVNNRRSNYPHGNVTGNVTYTSNDGCKLGTGTGSTTVFEPMDNYKGDIARIYFYFVTCYQDKIPNYSFGAFAKNTYPSLNSNFLSVYLQWAKDDPVSQKEIDRNNVVYATQGNRNPFVDCPYAVGAIWDSNNASDYGTKGYYTDGSGSSSTDPSATITGSSSVTVGNSISLTAALTNVTSTSLVTWESSDTSKATVTQGTTSTTSSVASVTGVAAGTVTIRCKYNGTIIGSKSITVNSSSGGGGSDGDDADSISVGDQVVLVTKDASMEMTSWSGASTNYGIGTSYSETPAGTLTFTVASGTTTGTYSFKNGSNYLYWSSGNSLSSATSTSANTSWNVSFDSDKNATITNAGDSTRQIWWNVSSPRFACYTGKSAGNSYYAVQLYKLSGSSGGDTPEKTLTSIAVKTAPTKTSYTAGEYFDPSGLVITCTYNDSSTADVTYSSGNSSSFTFSPSTSTALTTSNTSVSITYGGKSCSQAITVSSSGGSSDTYSIVFKGNGTSNDSGSAITAENLISSTYYTSNTLVSSCSSADRVYQGKNDTGIKIGYGSGPGSLTLSILSAAQTSVTKISVVSSSYGSDSGTLSLKSGSTTLVSSFNPSDGCEYNFSTASTVSSITLATSTKRAYISSITFTVGGSVTPTPEKVLDSISATYTGEAIYVDDPLDEEAFTVTASYTDSTTYPDETVTTGWTVSGFDSSEAGTNTVTITYEGKTCTVDLTILENDTPVVPTGDDGEASWTANAQGYTNAQVLSGTSSNIYSTDITVSFTKNTGNDVTYYDSGASVRLYSYNSFTIKSTKSNIKQIVLTFGTGDGSNTISVDTGSYSNGTWTCGSSYESSVTFTIEYKKSNNRRIAGITVSYYGANNFSEDFLSTITCNGGSTAPSVSNWNSMRDNKYSLLFDADKTTLAGATASESGTVIEKAMARYDFIIGKYNKQSLVYDNYISRSGSGVVAHNPLSIDTSTATIIIIATSMAAITIIGGALILKRKEQ